MYSRARRAARRDGAARGLAGQARHGRRRGVGGYLGGEHRRRSATTARPTRVNTYLLYLRFQLMRGVFTPERYEAEMRPAARHAREAHRAALARVPVALEDLRLRIESLDPEGRGVARNAEGKVVFVEGALAGRARRVARSLRQEDQVRHRPRTEIVGAPPAGASRAARTSASAAAAPCSTPMRARRWRPSSAGWRRTSRASARCSPRCCCRSSRRGMGLPPPRAAVGARTSTRRAACWSGFRERRSTYVADMRECHVLPPRICALIAPLRELVGNAVDPASGCRRSRSRSATTPTVLVFRHLDAAHRRRQAALEAIRRDARRARLAAARRAGQRAAVPSGARASSTTRCRSSACASHFRPTDFTQVNPAVNRVLVSRAVRLLDPQPGERVADLFCGLGNFSLPLAARGAQVIGFEGSAALVERARAERRGQRPGGAVRGRGPVQAATSTPYGRSTSC